MSLRSLLIFIALAPYALLLAEDGAKVEAKYDWGVAYYLSYDNNLAPAMPAILKQIRSGVTANAIAAVQVDLPGAGGMERAALVAGHESKVIKLASDDSADEGQAIAFFEWFTQNYPCKHYVFAFLDHGGDLDELCLDLNPDTKDKFYMSGRVLGEKLRKFKATLKTGQLDLLFFQQCGRGSLENLYSFRGCAEYVLVSPVNVGSPNSYYAPLHAWLSKHPDATGKDVAEQIASTDTDYTAYTCVNSAKIGAIPAKLDAALKPLLARATVQVAPRKLSAVYTNPDSSESTVDLKSYLAGLAADNGAGAEMAAFQKWVEEELIVKAYIQKDHASAAKGLSGLALFVPRNADEAAKYKTLDLYKDSALGSLWTKMYPGKTAEAKR